MKNNMFKDMKRQVHAKKNTVGALTITILMVMVSLSVFLVIVPERVEAASYGDFVNYKEITIESDYIDASLTNFPILIHDSTGNLLGNILTNASDIAFFNSAKDTQFNHEVERYNSTSGELWAWVNITSISSSADTTLYMYYNDSDGGYPIGYNTEDVWNSDFEMVQHMNGSNAAGLDDSTSNNNDVASDSGTPDYEYEDSDTIGYAVYFNESLSSYILFADSVKPGFPATWEVYMNPDNNDSNQRVVDSGGGDSTYKGILIMIRTTAEFGMHFRDTDDSTNLNKVGSNTVGNNTNSVTYLAIKWAGIGGYAYFYHGTEKTAASSIDQDSGSIQTLTLGIRCQYLDDFYYNGTIDEIRISNVNRSDAWLYASFHSLNETTGFITLGSQQGGEAASSFSLKGLTSGHVTWAGLADTTVWCNSSGDGNEWVEINMSINASDNVTEFRVWMDDLNDTSAYINASNITAYVSSDNNPANYGELGSFPDGGGNCTTYINNTNWNAGTMGANPFTGEGLTNKTASIYIIFKLTLPADLSEDDFWTSTATSCKVYIGH